MKPQVPLQIGLSFTYIYSGLGLIREPSDWFHFIPAWLFDLLGSNLERFLQVQGLGELLLGTLLLLSYSKPRLLYILSVLGALHVFGIILVSGVDLITFRDLGLLGAWVALALLGRERVLENK